MARKVLAEATPTVQLLVRLIDVFRKVHVGLINRNSVGTAIRGMLFVNNEFACDYLTGPLA